MLSRLHKIVNYLIIASLVILLASFVIPFLSALGGNAGALQLGWIIPLVVYAYGPFILAGLVAFKIALFLYEKSLVWFSLWIGFIVILIGLQISTIVSDFAEIRGMNQEFAVVQEPQKVALLETQSYVDKYRQINNTFDGVCELEQLVNLQDSLPGYQCSANAGTYRISFEISEVRNDGKTRVMLYCIDSQGFVGNSMFVYDSEFAVASCREL